MTHTIMSAGARTPIGKLGGALSSLTAVDLGAAAVACALERAGIDGSAVDTVLMGNVVQAGVGPNPARQLGAEFLAAVGGDVTVFNSQDRLAAIAGLAPVPRDSGRIRGNHRRPRRYDRRLLRVFYLSAQLSIVSCSESRTYYDRKRGEGKRHTQAVLALARRRSNVLWAMLRDDRLYIEPAAAPAAA
ncbi:transposase [Antrihabitans spumae]|uniref:Transposase n=1 Tax=Antrihabitans spumae TaxID=3373370 RepID=A0ABW7JWV3_9NOCA